MDAPGRSSLAALAVLAVLGIGACGDDEGSAQQDVVNIDLVSADFAKKQRLAHEESLELVVRNPGNEPVEQFTVAIAPDGEGVAGTGFGSQTGGAGAGDPNRPVWIVDEIPLNSVTADSGVFRAGPIAAGRTLKLRWRLQPVRRGDHQLRWQLGGRVDGTTRVVDGSGEDVGGTFDVTIGE
ncbi:MAG: hypothetical protein V9E83_02475 [Baekduia sp.]